MISFQYAKDKFKYQQLTLRQLDTHIFNINQTLLEITLSVHHFVSLIHQTLDIRSWFHQEFFNSSKITP